MEKEDFIKYIVGNKNTEFVATDLLDNEIERLDKGDFLTPHNAFLRKLYANGRIKLGEAAKNYDTRDSFLYALALGFIQRADEPMPDETCKEETKGANIIHNLEEKINIQEKINIPYIRKTLEVKNET